MAVENQQELGEVDLSLRNIRGEQQNPKGNCKGKTGTQLGRSRKDSPESRTETEIYLLGTKAVLILRGNMDVLLEQAIL